MRPPSYGNAVVGMARAINDEIAEILREEKGKDPMREKLAALMHEIWGEWWDYQFQKGYHKQIMGEWHNTFIIPDDLVKRWNRQKNTPYDDLSEEEKNGDRKVADKVLALLKAHFAASG